MNFGVYGVGMAESSVKIQNINVTSGLGRAACPHGDKSTCFAFLISDLFAFFADCWHDLQYGSVLCHSQGKRDGLRAANPGFLHYKNPHY